MYVLSLLALAIAPGTAIVIFIYLKDKHEREPLSLLLLSFIFGLISPFVTLVLGFPLSSFVFAKGDLIEEFFHAFFKVALIEEFSKFIFIRWILYRNKNFNEPFDGIIYSVMVGMGFATLENILYVFEYGVTTGVLRMFTAVPAHATFAVLMGFFLGKAKFSHKREWLFSLVALIAATIFHGAYDYFWFVSHISGLWVGAVASLLVGFMLSRRAIGMHQKNSPFIPAPPAEINPEFIQKENPEN